jgi:hypothetical protein
MKHINALCAQNYAFLDVTVDGRYCGIGHGSWDIVERKTGSQLLVEVKNGVFWDVMPCGSCNSRRFGGT